MSNEATVFMDTGRHGFSGFETYFKHAKMVRMHPFHQDLYVTNVVSVSQMSLTTLAISIKNLVKPGTNILIYAHAEPNNFVFPVDITKPKNDFDVVEAAKISYHLDLLSRDAASAGSWMVDPFLVDPYVPYVDPFHKTDFQDKSPDYLKIKKQFGEYVMDQLLEIRKLKLNHLAIRACRVGQNKDFMRFLGLMFGVKSVSAPKYRTAAITGRVGGMITMKPEEKQRFFDAAKQIQHGVNGSHVYQYPHPARAFGIKDPLMLSFTVVPTGKVTFLTSQFVASEPEAAFEFLRLTAGYTALPSEVGASGVLAFHALQGPASLVFPLEREYLQNMTFVQVKN